MTTFEEREKAFEDKYKHDENLRFKVEVRRNRLLGQWIAAEFLGKTGADVDAYGKQMVAADFERPGDSDLIEKINADLEAVGVELSEHRLRRKMKELLVEAKHQVMQE